MLRSIARGEDRSPLFWWMVDHHDEIVANAGKRIRWKGVCAQAAARGLTDAKGNPPSERTARATWRKARLAVAAARSAEAAKSPARPGSIYPSRIPKDWKPEPFRKLGPAGSGTAVALCAPALPVAPASAESGVPATPPAHRTPRFLGSPDDPPEVQEMWANLEDQFDKEDRWAGGLPVKRRR